MKITFGTEVFGFSRKDVSKYIQKLSIDAKEALEQSEKKCAEYERRCLEAEGKTEGLEAALRESEEKARKLADAYNELCLGISNLIADSQDKLSQL